MSQAFAYAPALTVDEFAVWPGDGVNRLHALIDGVPVAMNPPALRHSLLLGELAERLGHHLKATRPACRVLIEPGVQPRAGASTNVRIPDLVVACGPIGRQLLTNPLVIVEILSPSNAGETREAVRACLSIASLREVLVIDSLGIRAEHMARQPDGLWPADPTPLGPGDDLVLEAIGFRTPLASFYGGMDFEPG